MSKILIALVMATAPILAYANCTNHSYMLDGRWVLCQTCCNNGNCTTTCY